MLYFRVDFCFTTDSACLYHGGPIKERSTLGAGKVLVLAAIVVVEILIVANISSSTSNSNNKNTLCRI